MPTQTKENYLKAIYFLDENNQEINISDIAKEMEVSAPTVNNMVKKLAGFNWVKYQKYKPLTLTRKGRKAAALIIRKHRLTEMFLTQVMGFGWEEVHDIAEEMEHLNSEVFFDRMDSILGKPKVDPHGSPIPNKEGELESNAYQKLKDLEVGATATLRAVSNSSAELLLYLNDKKIKLGTIFQILKIESYDGGVTVTYDDANHVTLSQKVASKLMVERKTKM